MSVLTGSQTGVANTNLMLSVLGEAMYDLGLLVIAD